MQGRKPGCSLKQIFNCWRHMLHQVLHHIMEQGLEQERAHIWAQSVSRTLKGQIRIEKMWQHLTCEFC